MVDGIFRFNKGESVNLTNFNGVSKEELSSRKDVTNNQKKLIESIFKQYDKNNDGILSKEEYDAMSKDLQKVAGNDNLSKRELKKFNKNCLGVDKKNYEMSDLQKVMTMMTDDSDSVTNVEKRVDSDAIETTYNDDGSYSVTRYNKNDNAKTTTNYDKNGNEIPDTEQNEEDKKKDVDVEKSANDDKTSKKTTEYQVQSGEVWYNIVAAKYDVSSPKTIMNIVHQLKDAAGIDYKSTKMPSTLQLPNKINVGEQEFSLKLENEVDPSLLRTEAPPAKAKANETENTDITLPKPIPKEKLPKTILPVAKKIQIGKFPHGMPMQDKKYAGKTIKVTSGKKEDFLKYNSDGRLIYIYSNKAAKDANRPCVAYFWDGNDIDRVYKYGHDSNGNLKQLVCYNKNGRFYHRSVFDQYPKNVKNSNNRYGRRIFCEADGGINSIYVYTYDNKGEILSTDDFKSDGSLRRSVRYLYDDKGNSITREYFPQDKGKMSK